MYNITFLPFLANFKKWKWAYQITSLCVCVCVCVCAGGCVCVCVGPPLITFEPIGGFSWNLVAPTAIQGNFEFTFLIS
jgi:hypothetical protein